MGNTGTMKSSCCNAELIEVKKPLGAVGYTCRSCLNMCEAIDTDEPTALATDAGPIPIITGEDAERFEANRERVDAEYRKRKENEIIDKTDLEETDKTMRERQEGFTDYGGPQIVEAEPKEQQSEKGAEQYGVSTKVMNIIRDHALNPMDYYDLAKDIESYASQAVARRDKATLKWIDSLKFGHGPKDTELLKWMAESYSKNVIKKDHDTI